MISAKQEENTKRGTWSIEPIHSIAIFQKTFDMSKHCDFLYVKLPKRKFIPKKQTGDLM